MPVPTCPECDTQQPRRRRANDRCVAASCDYAPTRTDCREGPTYPTPNGSRTGDPRDARAIANMNARELVQSARRTRERDELAPLLLQACCDSPAIGRDERGRFVHTGGRP